jgi:5'-3' exonuclease
MNKYSVLYINNKSSNKKGEYVHKNGKQDIIEITQNASSIQLMYHISIDGVDKRAKPAHRRSRRCKANFLADISASNSP